jgi:hypothetical protein
VSGSGLVSARSLTLCTGEFVPFGMTVPSRRWS